MNKEKVIELYSDLLSELATEISQTCSERNSVLNIYMGTSLPQLQLDLFKPILLENYMFLCSYLKDTEVLGQLLVDSQDIATSLKLDFSTFKEARFKEYASSPDATALYTKFCIFIIRNRANAPSLEVLPTYKLKEFSSNTPLTLQLSAKRMREAAESI